MSGKDEYVEGIGKTSSLRTLPMSVLYPPGASLYRNEGTEVAVRVIVAFVTIADHLAFHNGFFPPVLPTPIPVLQARIR